MARKKAVRKRSAVVSSRMDPDLRKQLEESAKAHSDGNVTRELDRLLRMILAFEGKVVCW
jgi:hypothetical protein